MGAGCLGIWPLDAARCKMQRARYARRRREGLVCAACWEQRFGGRQLACVVVCVACCSSDDGQAGRGANTERCGERHVPVVGLQMYVPGVRAGGVVCRVAWGKHALDETEAPRTTRTIIRF